MNTIVMNTLTGAVTEYNWGAECVTPSLAASEDGLFQLGGDADDGENIAAEFKLGEAGGDNKLALGNVYFGIDGAGAGQLIVECATGNYSYPVTVRSSGVSRAIPGRGIDANALILGYRNLEGADFRITRMDAEIVPKTRRL